MNIDEIVSDITKETTRSVVECIFQATNELSSIAVERIAKLTDDVTVCKKAAVQIKIGACISALVGAIDSQKQAYTDKDERAVFVKNVIDSVTQLVNIDIKKGPINIKFDTSDPNGGVTLKTFNS